MDKWWLVLAILPALVVLTPVSNAQVGRPVNYERRPKDACICLAIYEPVCARIGYTYTTYGNDCRFTCEKKKRTGIIHEGECNNNQPYGEIGSCICTREYDPVCGRIDGKTYTFGNKCTFDCASGKIITHESCEDYFGRCKPIASGYRDNEIVV